MARALGVDPATQQPIEFDIADPNFMQAYFEILHHPYEAMGVDFWWLDWQQGTRSKLSGLDPLMGLNHLHFYDLGRDRFAPSLHLLALVWPGESTLPDRLFRRLRGELGITGVSTLLHGHGGQRRLWLVESRHRRAHAGP